MGKKALGIAATAVMGISGVLAASPASADVYQPTRGGGYESFASPLTCTGEVYNGALPSGGAGGTLSLRVAADEFRLPSTHFRTASVVTRIIAQERNYFGVWKDVAWGPRVSGKLGPAHAGGTYNFARVNWGGTTTPRLRVHVVGFDDLFRAKVVHRFYNDEGNLIARLVDRRGQCQL